MLIKLVALLIAAAGAGLALFGDTVRQRRLTSKGSAALVLILAGFLTNLVLEYVEYRKERIQAQWRQTETQPLYSLIAFLLYDDPTPVSQFAHLLTQTGFAFGTFATLEGEEPTVRYLTFVRRRGATADSNVEAAILLAVTDRVPDTLARASGDLFYREFGSGSFASGVTKRWNSWDSTTVGIRIQMPFSSLKLEESIRIVGDLSHLTSLTIRIPVELDLRKAFWFYLLFVTADQQVLWLDLTRLDYSLDHESKHFRHTTISGVALLETLRKEFEGRGGRSAVGVAFDPLDRTRYYFEEPPVR